MKKKKKTWMIPLVAIIVAAVVLFRPAGTIPFDKTVSNERLLIQYEIFGCGSLVVKVLDGGEEVTERFKEEYPEVAVNEIVFSDDSVQPKDFFNSGDFYTGGIAEKYTYIIEGEAMRVTEGAPDCCEPGKVAYHETVIEFKADSWYFAEYVPYVATWSNLFVIFGAMFIMWIASIWLFVLAVRVIILKNRM